VDDLIFPLKFEFLAARVPFLSFIFIFKKKVFLELLMTQPHGGRQLFLFVVVDLKKYNFYFSNGD